MGEYKDNPHWRLTGDLMWRLSSTAPKDIVCPRCNGHRYFGGGFGSFADEEKVACDECLGSGVIRSPDLMEKPEVPHSYFLAMAKAHHEYIAEQRRKEEDVNVGLY